MAKHKMLRVVCDGHRGFAKCQEAEEVPTGLVLDAEDHLKNLGWTFGKYDLCWNGHDESRDA